MKHIQHDRVDINQLEQELNGAVQDEKQYQAVAKRFAELHPYLRQRWLIRLTAEWLADRFKNESKWDFRGHENALSNFIDEVMKHNGGNHGYGDGTN